MCKGEYNKSCVFYWDLVRLRIFEQVDLITRTAKQWLLLTKTRARFFLSTQFNENPGSPLSFHLPSPMTTSARHFPPGIHPVQRIDKRLILLKAMASSD